MVILAVLGPSSAVMISDQSPSVFSIYFQKNRRAQVHRLKEQEYYGNKLSLYPCSAPSRQPCQQPPPSARSAVHRHPGTPRVPPAVTFGLRGRGSCPPRCILPFPADILLSSARLLPARLKHGIISCHGWISRDEA